MHSIHLNRFIFDVEYDVKEYIWNYLTDTFTHPINRTMDDIHRYQTNEFQRPIRFAINLWMYDNNLLALQTTEDRITSVKSSYIKPEGVEEPHPFFDEVNNNGTIDQGRGTT